ncbi:MAG: tRNA (guanosine(37)-N1)-methyltransferase TrmD [Elusimicrobia bacterium RIFCSPLOWO2_01_FULL_59_12]|nr:MAG: tRNA (guanosine(37)-N1)-methyltransferase TrmD [Elusimicrobia bacterium RIFCSPLOWO2_01_FULL_59_12]
MNRLDIITIFPGMFEGPLTQSLLGKARQRGLIDLRLHNLRDFSADAKHRAVDDRPFGGGAGMVIQPEPVYRALKHIRGSRVAGATRQVGDKPYVVHLSPQGRALTQADAQTLSERPWLVFICGHYEGMDERVMKWVDAEVSIGDYVLTGGELPAMVLADVVLRLVPGVVKDVESIRNDSFQTNRLDHPHYTRPALWRGKRVPAVLLSGDHERVRAWRSQQAECVTLKKRPDLVI